MTFDVIVIGGGIIGASCAYELSKNGKKVAVVEKRHLSSGASGASAAMLEFQIDAHRGEPFYSLALASNNLFPALAQEIKSLTGGDFQYEKCGILHVASTEEESESIESEVKRLQSLGHKTSWLDQEALQKECPYLNTDNLGAALYEEDGQVNGEVFVSTLMAAAQKNGAEIFPDAGDVHIVMQNGKAQGVKTSRGIFYAETIVVCAGAWTDQLLSPFGHQLGIKPVRGQLVIYDTPNNFLQRPIYTQRHGYLTPKRNGFTLAGTTVENVGFDETTTDQARADIIKMAVALVPGLARKDIRGLSAGLRPSSPDNLPFIGPLPGHPEILIAAGHYRNGFLLAPITGRAIAAIATAKKPPLNLEPFSPSRILSPRSSK